MDKKVVLDNTILLVRHGSHAYGLNHADSDIDAKGVVVPPPEWYLGLRHFEQFEDFDDPNDFSRDQVRYKVQKFISLASDCNPNIIECLFVDESDIVEITPEGRELVAHRNDFVSLKAKHTFSGYAVSQLKKIQIKRKWFVEPPTHKPLQSEFMRSPTTETEMGLLAEGAKFFDKAAYVAAIEHWNNYLRWKNERNPARKELEEKFGFDSKHASQLVRLLRMGKEICEFGKVVVKRPDREEILAIRNGAWTYEQLVDWAEKVLTSLDALYNDYKSGLKIPPIPHSVDRGAIDRLAVDITLKHWSRKQISLPWV